LNFRTLLLLNYVLVVDVSGIVHLSAVPDAPRGFYDLLADIGDPGIELGVYASFLGLAGLVVASLQKLPAAPAKDVSLSAPWLVREEKFLVAFLVLALVPLGIISTMQLQAYADASGTERIIALTDGNARTSYFSNWLTWGVSFLAVAVAGSRAGRGRLMVFLVGAGATLAITAALAWTGGRSIIIVMVLPIVLVLLPRLRGVRWLAVPAAAVAAASYMISISQTRSASTGGFNFATWLDWEWGRFSMIGFAQKSMEVHGPLYGETFLAGLSNVFLGIFRLVGMYIPNPDLRTSTELSGELILSSSDQLYVVPGLTAELFLNFGLVGVALGFYFLGRITSWADRKFLEAPTVLAKLTFAYVGTLLVFRTVAADSGSILSYLIYSGFPLIIAALCSKVARRMAATRTERNRILAEQLAAGRALAAERREANRRRMESIPPRPAGADPIEMLRRLEN
jgi:oligosaccharide repeat unit polymerase